MRNYYEEMTSLQKHHYFSVFFHQIVTFLRKSVKKLFLQIVNYDQMQKIKKD